MQPMHIQSHVYRQVIRNSKAHELVSQVQNPCGRMYWHLNQHIQHNLDERMSVVLSAEISNKAPQIGDTRCMGSLPLQFTRHEQQQRNHFRIDRSFLDGIALQLCKICWQPMESISIPKPPRLHAASDHSQSLPPNPPS